MNEMLVVELGRNAVVVMLLLSAPMLAAALVVGLAVGILQAVTQINEVTLSFVPKILAVFGAVAVAGSWLLHTALSYTVQLFSLLPQMVR
jgi:flagellar biosynthetic protein FliQ